METTKNGQRYRTLWITLCCLALALVYVFQRVDYWSLLLWLVGSSADQASYSGFIFNKAGRLFVNDVICFSLIFVLFREKKYLRVAFLVFCFEFFLVLPLYLLIKLRVEGSSEISSPLLSQIHRLIVNPMLMLLLIVAFYYQRFTTPPQP